MKERRIKIECPTSWLHENELHSLLFARGFSNSHNPEFLIVNPGTSYFLGQEYFMSYPDLKVVGTPSTGTNHIDVNYLRDKNIKVVSLLDNREALDAISASAEFTWLHIMNLYRKFQLATRRTKEWRCIANEDFLRSHELQGKSIGIIGLGRIGKRIAKYAQAFDMMVHYYDPYVSNESSLHRVDAISELSKCDIVSINCALTGETHNLISRGVFDEFKEGVVIVNTSRGEVVDEEYICELICNNKIVYGCDVIRGEQKQLSLGKSPLLQLAEHDNVCITPHVAGATVESQSKALECILELFDGCA